MNHLGNSLRSFFLVHGYIFCPFIKDQLLAEGHSPQLIINHTQLQRFNIVSDFGLNDLALTGLFPLFGIDVDSRVDNDSNVGEIESISVVSLEVKVYMSVPDVADFLMRHQHFKQSCQEYDSILEIDSIGVP